MTLKSSLSIARGLTLAICSVAALSACGATASEHEEQTAIGETSQALLGKCAPAVPDPSLEVPAGNALAFDFDAVGVQIYACQAATNPTGTSYAWVFQAPEANLYDHGRLAGKHYAGPTWEYRDGSKVVGSKVAAFTPDVSAIPWLLLKAASHEGDGRMSEITYVQRLDTTAGLAPATGCDADHVGAVARVDYTATYYFYKASDRPACACHHR